MELVLVIVLAVVAYTAWSGLKKKDEVKEDVAPSGPVKEPTNGEVLKKVPTEKELNRLTKVNLEKLGREYGVELDRRKTKANMIKDFLGRVNLH